MRIPQEFVKIDGEANNGGREKDRQRIRARLGAYTEINPQVDTGIRIATGGGDDARSTNQDQDNYFDKKQIWLDLGYIDYHPDAIKNLHVIGGKMQQPWVSMGDVIWDGDINPEGLAVTYSSTRQQCRTVRQPGQLQPQGQRRRRRRAIPSRPAPDLRPVG